MGTEMSWVDGGILLMTRRDDGTSSRLGTAFCVALDGTFMTARHLLDRVKPDETLIAVPYGKAPCDVEELARSPRFDIAVARIQPRKGEQIDVTALPLSFGFGPVGARVATAEFSRSENGKTWQSIRMGNIVTPRSFALKGFAETECLEVSFETFGGASGAAVVLEETGVVTGMILGEAVTLEPPEPESIVPGRVIRQTMAMSSRDLLDFAREHGLELKLFMTASLPTILEAATALKPALLEAAKKERIVHHTKVTSITPQAIEATIEQVTDNTHDIPFTLTIAAKVEGWTTESVVETGATRGLVEASANVRGTIYAQRYNGRLSGPPQVWCREVEVFRVGSLFRQIVLLESEPEDTPRN